MIFTIIALCLGAAYFIFKPKPLPPAKDIVTSSGKVLKGTDLDAAFDKAMHDVGVGDCVVIKNPDTAQSRRDALGCFEPITSQMSAKEFEGFIDRKLQLAASTYLKSLPASSPEGEQYIEGGVKYKNTYYKYISIECWRFFTYVWPLPLHERLVFSFDYTNEQMAEITDARITQLWEIAFAP